MIVSWEWLKTYVPLEMDLAELEQRLSMAGLNHESTESIGGDLAIDLEVTSNRPDCLGHLGVAREVAVLWDLPLTVENPQLPSGGPNVDTLAKVSVECPELCSRYTARVLRGVRIGPSPEWLARRLRTLGLAVINNVVDATNYVTMECGQPLHAFDLSLLRGHEIIVREAVKGEPFEAIDHRQYSLDPGMCVIADSGRAVALGGVMGGVDSEVTDATRDVLIESAQFAPLSIRTTARKLNLHSPSSYRFERSVDPEGVEWASRRCCQLILEIAGGECAEGMLDVGAPAVTRKTVTLRLSQLPRILGIDVEAGQVERILAALGGSIVGSNVERVEIVPPSWRRDLTREIDLIEEVARIHGYEKIPEDVGVPMTATQQLDSDRVLQSVRKVLTAAGFDEGVTASVVPTAWNTAFSPWTDAEPLVSSTPMLKGADRLRTSLVPSLLECRRHNESVGNERVELFETARIYLPNPSGLPREPWTLAIVTDGSFFRLKGVVQALIDALRIDQPLAVDEARIPALDAQEQCRLMLGDRDLGYLGRLADRPLKAFGLRRATMVAELDLGALVEAADLLPQHQHLSEFPAIGRDLNLIVDERVRWADLQRTARQAAGPLLEELQFQEVYRDPQKDGSGKKRMLFSIQLRSAERTLTNEEADSVHANIVEQCAANHKAVLLG